MLGYTNILDNTQFSLLQNSLSSRSYKHDFQTRTLITFVRFVDGAGYMAAVADAMEAAKEEIFITDWW